MKFPIFASFIVFCIWLTYEVKKHRNMEEKAYRSFWDKEIAANGTRRKSLEGLNYIHIPFEALPMDTLKDNPVIAEYHETLRGLSESPIVNFTGISNTDLKLMYGAPNIDILSRYDQSYTTLALTLQSLAQALYEKGCVKEACQVLEFAIDTRTDISASYKLLASIYQQNGQPEKIAELIPIANSLNASQSPRIVSMLEELIK